MNKKNQPVNVKSKEIIGLHMIPFFIKYSKIVYLILALIPLYALLLIVNVYCFNCLDDNWVKVIISILPILIALIELGDIVPKGKPKKSVMYFLFITLFSLTIWDTTNDSIKDKNTAIERDSVILKDSLRAARIITDLGTALGKIDSSTQNLVRVDSSIGNVKGVLDNQVSKLTSVVSESKEVQKNLTGGDSYLKLFLLKNWRYQTLELHCSVIGEYPMHNLNLKINCRSFRDDLRKKPVKLEPLVYGSGVNMAFNVSIQSLSANNNNLLIAKFNVDDFKKDILLSMWTFSNNGSTLQLIKWDRHKQYFSVPPKIFNTTLKSDLDWSGKGFGYSSRISRVSSVQNQIPDDKSLDDMAGIFYNESYATSLNLYNQIVIRQY